MNILVANIGSTSFKYQLLNPESGVVLAKGRIERIGQIGGDCADYNTAISRCMASLKDPIDGIGFKAVHAGPLSGAHRVDDRVLAAMEEYSFFAPAHNPPYIAAMRSFREALPQMPLVALFETAFFDKLSEASTTYAVPLEWKSELGVRRYGFHGASHRAASEKAQELAGRKQIRHISCHLGGSSSLAAIRSGVAVDTSFGMSPQSGLPHNNRTGDLDVFAALYVMKRRGMSIEEMADALSTQSGLAGISGTSGDMRDLEEAKTAQARLAIDVLVRSVRHYIGAFLVELGGVDVVTFSGGIGENSPEVRAGVCARLEGFGIQLENQRNDLARGEARISTDSSPAAIWIVPADEERIVARATAEVIRGSNA